MKEAAEMKTSEGNITKLPVKTTKRKNLVYQLKITLEGIRPPIWRRVIVPSKITFFQLHIIIQIAFGWENCHMFQFCFNDTDVTTINEDDFSFSSARKSKDVMNTKIDKLLTTERQCIYEYDFGDNWEHSVILEDILEADPQKQYPVCVKGKRRCPPEDVGGPYGYSEFLETISDPENPERQEMIEWAVGEDGIFDPEEFNLEDLNEVLKDFRDYA